MATTRHGPPPIKLTYGQTILWLLSQGKVRANALLDYEKLYLTGPEPQKHYLSRIHLDNLLRKESGSYFMMAEPDRVFFASEDPVRRYFETHLAWHTLQQSLKNLEMATLEKLRAALHHYSNETYVLYLQLFLEEDMVKLEKVNCILQEYGDINRKIKRAVAPFDQLPKHDREKLQLLVHCLTLSYLITFEQNASLPIAIHNAGYYQDHHRGRRTRTEADEKKTRHYGLIRPHAPLPCSDIAYMPTINAYSKPSERMTFDVNATFPRYLFSQAVHPFSTSLSGTMLFQLRVLKRLSECRLFNFPDAKALTPWLQALISLLLFHSGGHSLCEFMTVFEFKDVQNAFTSLPGFAKINLQSLFCDNNRVAFTTALSETLWYQRLYLQRLALQQQLEQDALERIRSNIRACLLQIEAYGGTNKKGLIEGFKIQLGAILPDEPKLHQWEMALTKTRELLRNLKKADRFYYSQLHFFNRWREQNSSLALCISAAQDALNCVDYRKRLAKSSK